MTARQMFVLLASYWCIHTCLLDDIEINVQTLQIKLFHWQIIVIADAILNFAKYYKNLLGFLSMPGHSK